MRFGWKVKLLLGAAVLTFGGLLGAKALEAVDDAPGNTYSEGWRMGQLTTYGATGFPGLRTGEAELAHGVASSTGNAASMGRQTFTNPGRLSSTAAMADANQSMVGRSVAIRYRQVKVQITSLGGDTDYRIAEVTRVDPSLAPKVPCGSHDAIAASRGSVTTVGRLVKASDKGNITKSFEAVLQKGAAGDQFIALSIPDRGMMDCAVDFLRSGTEVRVRYAQGTMRDPLVSDTTRTITSIVAADTTTETQTP